MTDTAIRLSETEFHKAMEEYEIKLTLLKEKNFFFNSDQEAKEKGLKVGDHYIIKDKCAPYFMYPNTIKQVQEDDSEFIKLVTQ